MKNELDSDFLCAVLRHASYGNIIVESKTVHSDKDGIYAIDFTFDVSLSYGANLKGNITFNERIKNDT